MTQNPRAAFRALACAAIAADPRLQGLTQISAWAGNIDAEALPVFGVVTPQERVTPETLDSFERSTLLQVVLKRLGGDELEDRLDADADAIEPCVCLALLGAGYPCVPEDLTVTVNGDGAQRIGTLVMGFRVTWNRGLEG
ncbi:hypothetical protein [Cereibacter changlensis]|uniref:hypothetical protein n=1 Tax=Cereibacter changlensis TaxID=402884 RepID=UPI004033F199